MDTSLSNLMCAIDEFAAEREWDQFHTPKNLAGSILIEAGELLEVIQWDAPSFETLRGNEQLQARIQEELADVLNYALRFCSLLGCSPLEIVEAKLMKNQQKYPVEKAKGNATKYTDF